MPFITIEIPKDFAFDLVPFAKDVHAFLSESLGLHHEKLKTKLITISECVVGDGNPENSYSHIKLELMAGRDREKLKACTKELLTRFSAALQKQNPNRQSRITCEFREIDPDLIAATLLM